MKVRADLHNHLRTLSNLRQKDFNIIIDLARQRLGENGIFAFVNFNDKRYERFIGLKGYERDYIREDRTAVYVPEKQVLVVKGQEIPTKQGHLLVLGIGCDEHIKPDRTLEDTLKEAGDKNAIVIEPHGYSKNGIGFYLEDNIGLYFHLNAVETHNGETLRKVNQKARTRYRELKSLYPYINLGALSSSDGHSFHELGTNWTEIEMPDLENPLRFVHSLRN